MAANRSAALRRTSSFGALVAFEIGAVVVLHRLGELPWLRIPFGDLDPWLQATAPEDAIAAVARVIALAAAWWLLASTTLYVLARLSRVPGAIHAIGWVTLPAVRRVADQALALTLATSLVSGGANAALVGPAALGPTRAGPMVTLHDRAGQPAETPPLGHQPHPAGPPRVGHEPGPAGPGRWGAAPAYDPRPAGPARRHADHQEADPPPSTTTPPGTTTPPSTTAPPGTTGLPGTTAPPGTYTPQPAGPPSPGPVQPGPQTPQARPDVHRVQAGDNLWTIARDRLADATGRDADALPEPEVARYWLEVVQANRAGLRSGDPDLIYPGELVRLPPTDRRRR